MIIRLVKKRDGREVPFDPRKIADAIFRAARSVGGDDRLLAEELASVVTLFVEREYADRTPAIEDVQDLVEKVLIDTGHGRTAKSYILYREKRRAIHEQLTVQKENRARAGSVDVASSNRSMSWDKHKIAAELQQAAGLDLRPAEEVASAVEEQVLRCRFSRISTSLIREFVRHELTERGIDLPVAYQGQVGIDVARFDPIVSGADPRGEALEESCGRFALCRYAEARLFPGTLIEAQLDGRIHLGGLDCVARLVRANVHVLPNNRETNIHYSASALGWSTRRARGMVEEELAMVGFENFFPASPNKERVEGFETFLLSSASTLESGPRLVVYASHDEAPLWIEAIDRVTSNHPGRPLECDLQKLLPLVRVVGTTEKPLNDQKGESTIRPPLLARTGINLLRLVVNANGSDRILLADLDEALRMAADGLDQQVKWLNDHYGDDPEYHEIRRGEPGRVALYPLLIGPALCAQFYSKHDLERHGKAWLAPILKRVDERFSALISRYELGSEIHLLDWPIAQSRLLEIDRHLHPSCQRAIDRVSHEPDASLISDILHEMNTQQGKRDQMSGLSATHANTRPLEAGRMTS